MERQGQLCAPAYKMPGARHFCDWGERCYRLHMPGQRMAATIKILRPYELRRSGLDDPELAIFAAKP